MSSDNNLILIGIDVSITTLFRKPEANRISNPRMLDWEDACRILELFERWVLKQGIYDFGGRQQ